MLEYFESEKEQALLGITIDSNLAFENHIKPFHATGLFLYLLKTSENQRFSDIFRRYRKSPVARNRLIKIIYLHFSNC